MPSRHELRECAQGSADNCSSAKIGQSGKESNHAQGDGQLNRPYLHESQFEAPDMSSAIQSAIQQARGRPSVPPTTARAAVRVPGLRPPRRRRQAVLRWALTGIARDCQSAGGGTMVDVFHSSFWLEQSMSRFAFALLSMTLFAGMTSVIVSEARAAAAVCDVAACINQRCKRSIGRGIQVCNSGCQIDVAENQKKKLCK